MADFYRIDSQRRTIVAGTHAGLRGRRPTGERDHGAVALAMSGGVVQLTAVDLASAIDALEARGWSAERIARQVGCSSRTVQRHRARRRAS